VHWNCRNAAAAHSARSSFILSGSGGKVFGMA
jgi:hypothetical protein